MDVRGRELVGHSRSLKVGGRRLGPPHDPTERRASSDRLPRQLKARKPAKEQFVLHCKGGGACVQQFDEQTWCTLGDFGITHLQSVSLQRCVVSPR